MEVEKPGNRKRRRDEAKDHTSTREKADEPGDRKRTQQLGIAKVPVGVCVKVASLRPRYSDLEQWCKDPKHVLVTRHGRVFIGKGDEKHVFAYPSSQWGNPFKVKEHGLERSLELFDEHLTNKIADPAALASFLRLCEYDEIGCFCEIGAKCHRDVIRRKLREALEVGQPRLRVQ